LLYRSRLVTNRACALNVIDHPDAGTAEEMTARSGTDGIWTKLANGACKLVSGYTVGIIILVVFLFHDVDGIIWHKIPEILLVLKVALVKVLPRVVRVRVLGIPLIRILVRISEFAEVIFLTFHEFDGGGIIVFVFVIAVIPMYG